jgi:hypothetical protein
MTGKVVGFIRCERCAAIGQATVSEHWVDYGAPDGATHEYWTEPALESWSREITIDKMQFKITELIPAGHPLDPSGDGGEKWIDLCPTCKMGFATWWLEGRK